MAEETNVSQELIERLITRIEALEKKLDEKESKEKESKESKDKDKDSTAKKVADSITDAGNELFKETGKIMGSVVDATAEAMKETANAFSKMSDETDKDAIGEIPAAMVSIFRKMVDIQGKALDKFEESCKKYDD